MSKALSPGAEFSTTAEATEIWPAITARTDQIAMLAAGEFAGAGHPPHEAASLAAHALLTSAWRVAATGRAFVGGKPSAEAFAALAIQVALIGVDDV